MNEMRRSMMLGVVACLLATGGAGAKTPRESWGKPGVSLQTYRDEAIACARQAHYLDVSDTGAARALVGASRRIDNQLSGAAGVTDPVGAAITVGRELDAVQPARRKREIGELLHATLADCLTEHGYRRFRLTEQQADRLDTLPPGSDARHAFLHSLASDPQIVGRQALEADEARR